MTTEIERKFKVAEDWPLPPGTVGERLRQAYLTPSGAPVEFRVRAGEGTRLMTAKTFGQVSGAMVRQEVEFALSDEVFEQLWGLADGECLSKVRWTVPLGEHVATVDAYEGALNGLRVVEVEFDDLRSAREFVPPEWFGEEITGSGEWSNRELAALSRAVPKSEREPMSRHVGFTRLHNVRDLGGYRALDGRTVPWRTVYRADSLGKLQGADWEKFLALGIHTVIDLRYPWEIEAKGRVPEPERFDYVNLSIEHRPYDQADIDPDIDPWRYLADRFAEVTEDGADEIRQVLERIAHAPGPVVFHCTSGKDRTGLIAALLLTLLGVDRETILADFALTELATPRLVADWKAANPDRTLRWPGYGRAPAVIMELVLADLEARYGTVEGYLKDRVGLSGDTVDALRSRLLTDGGD